MYFRDLEPRDESALVAGLAVLRLPIRCGGRDPETSIVRPIAARLAKRGLARLFRWSAWTRGEGEVLGIEMQIGLDHPTREGLQAVACALRLAPLGSSVRFASGGEPVVFGGSEAIEVHLPRAGEPPAKAAARCAEALGREGHVRGWSIGAKETRLYIYGPESRTIISRIRPVLGEVPVRPLS